MDRPDLSDVRHRLRSVIAILGSPLIPEHPKSKEWILESVTRLREILKDLQDAPPNLVLVDDDPLIRALWSAESRLHGLTICTLDTIDGIGGLHSIPRTTPLFIDLKFYGDAGAGLRGIAMARSMGFHNIHIASGETIDKNAMPQGVSSVVGKDFPASTLGLSPLTGNPL